MNKSGIIDAVAAKAGLSKKDSEKAVNAVFAAVSEALAKGDNVQVIGFGTFEVRARSARAGRNLRTGEAIEIAASKVPAFKAGKALKDAVNK
ncbi:MAG: HU family DNA-binding protein [Clostridia bacterium]|nr:HU family DNA-binding protein [Clostridia bacterium]MCR5690137.1 HU family DNA-binding protein [Clostridiales bacterium]